MSKIIACVDGSQHAESVCALTAWAANKTKETATLLHVVPSHYDDASVNDLSGQIGFGAKTELLQELANIEADKARLEQKKGTLILTHASERLEASGVTAIEKLHQRGTLAETVVDLEDAASLVIIGKRGETAANTPQHLGSNLIRVTRAVNRPLLVATREFQPIKKFLIAYDGSPNSEKALQFAKTSPLLKGLECHLLMVCKITPTQKDLFDKAQTSLKTAGYLVEGEIKDDSSVDAAVSQYIETHSINLLVMGAYGHSAMRRWVFGSATNAQIDKAHVPVLLFR
jgi:nucleotide-binding universal stress UspA family protein